MQPKEQKRAQTVSAWEEKRGEKNGGLENYKESKKRVAVLFLDQDTQFLPSFVSVLPLPSAVLASVAGY